MRTVLGVVVGGVLSIVSFYLIPDVSFGRGALALALGIAVMLLFSVRLGMMLLLDFNPIKRRVLVVGSGKSAAKICRLRRRSDRRRFDVVGFVALTPADEMQAAELGIGPLLTLAEAREGAPWMRLLWPSMIVAAPCLWTFC
ncbi:MAG: hypothetical protein R3F24_02000 [Gammaproteobacteria bacterium]